MDPKGEAGPLPKALENATRVFVVRNLMRYCERDIDEQGFPLEWNTVGIGRVPISMHGVGVFYRRFFDMGEGEGESAGHSGKCKLNVLGSGTLCAGYFFAFRKCLCADLLPELRICH